MERLRKTNNKILITGGFGYIGNEVIAKLYKKYNLYVNDFSTEAIKRFYPIWHKKVNYIHDDVCDLKCPDVDLVIHLAAEVGYVACDKNSKQAIHTNIRGTENISKFNKPTLFFSTGSVYGNQTEICRETNECDPQTLYSKTKKQGEEILLKNLNELVIYRPATAYGISYNTRNDLLIHNLSELAVVEKSISIFEPHAKRTFYHVKKIAACVEFTLENWSQFKNNTFNIGHESGNVTKKRIVDLIGENVDFEIFYKDNADPDKRDYEVDYSKLNKIWNNGKINLAKNIKSIVDYYYYQNCKGLEKNNVCS